jgi:sterol desaturase/sphingolipid hydroxylase (fatty acid hydroxylase superfamily)
VVGPLSLVILGVILVAERVWPAQQRSRLARGYRHDVLLTALHATIALPLVTALTLGLVEVVRHLMPWIVLPQMSTVPRWAVVALIMVAMDGLNWFVHLANHHVRLMWRFHELHHSQEDMNVLTVFRTHPLIHVSYLLALVPGIVLLANGSLSITVLAVYGGIVAFAHSNTALSFGPLGRIFVSPNFHRIHHRLEGRQDVNMGFALSIWDQLFRTAVFPTKATVSIDTGLPGRPLLVEQAPPNSRHLRVLMIQLISPFRPFPERANLPNSADPWARPELEPDLGGWDTPPAPEALGLLEPVAT